MDEAKNCQAIFDLKPLNYGQLFDIEGSISPLFGKWFGMLTILSLSKEGGGEGFKRRKKAKMAHSIT